MKSAMDQGQLKHLAAALVLTITLVISTLLVRAAGAGDLFAFLRWGSLGQEYGLVQGYKVMVDRWPESILGGNWSAGGGDYPPLGFAWLYLLSNLADTVLGGHHYMALKTALLGFSFISTGMIWLVSGNVALAAAYQAATILSSTGLGYTDVVMAPFLIGALWAIQKGRPVLGFILFLISILFKWTPLVIAPFLLLHVLDISDFRSIGRALIKPLTWQLCAAFLIAVLCVGAIFGASPVQAFHLSLLQPYLSGNALNLPWAATFVARLLFYPDFGIGKELPIIVWPPAYLLPFRLIFFAFFGLIVLRFLRVERTFANCLLFSTVGALTYGVWNSAVHENHWFIALVPAFFLVIEANDSSARWISILVAVMLNVNLFIFYGIVGKEVISRVVGFDLSVILALLYGAIWFLVVSYAWSIAPARPPLFFPATRRVPEPDPNTE
jgi:hypothetical protein